MNLPGGDRGRALFDSSSQPHILGIPVLIDPELPDNTVVFRDRAGNTLHTVVLSD